MDNEVSYGEEVTITPRKYVFAFHHMGKMEAHYAIIGIAHVSDGYPLYYDAVNEKRTWYGGIKFCRKCGLQNSQQRERQCRHI